MKSCQMLFIRFKPVAKGQPQADGMVERANQTVIDNTSALCKGQGEMWAEHIGDIEYAINTRVSSVTHYSPYELVYGRPPPGPTYIDGLTEEEMAKPVPPDYDAEKLRARILWLQETAHRNQMEAAKRQVEFHDAHAKAHKINIHDVVWVYRKSEVEKGVTSKLIYRWKGTYVVKEAPSSHVKTTRFQLTESPKG